MTDTTTIEITTEQRDALVARKQHDREPYHEVVARLLDGAEADTSTDPDIEAALAELDMDGGPTYDDVKAACAAALREELPDGVFR